jgi:hypothetical protein
MARAICPYVQSIGIIDAGHLLSRLRIYLVTPSCVCFWLFVSYHQQREDPHIQGHWLIMQYLYTYIVVALSAILPVNAAAALERVPGLPYPLDPKGMRYTGPVTTGGRNVTVYGTVDVRPPWPSSVKHARTNMWWRKSMCSFTNWKDGLNVNGLRWSSRSEEVPYLVSLRKAVGRANALPWVLSSDNAIYFDWWSMWI